MNWTDRRPLAVIDLDDHGWDHRRPLPDATMRIGVATRPVPACGIPLTKQLTLTLAPGGAGRGWVDLPDSLPDIEHAVSTAPGAASTLVDLLGITSRLPVADGVVAESFAYSMLLGGPEFAAWRHRTPARPVTAKPDAVQVTRSDGLLEITLNHPERHNAFGRATRDALYDALSVAQWDPTIERVTLRGHGPSFCSGGDLDEFGSAIGIVEAHGVRLARSCGLAVHRVRDRIRPVLHGACIGAGIEIPAFAHQVLAHDGTWFQLPELALGLVPGAGGTASIVHRIGVQRTAWMVLSGRRLDLDRALAWGLVDGRA